MQIKKIRIFCWRISEYFLYYLIKMVFSRATVMVIGSLAGACVGFYVLNIATQKRNVNYIINIIGKNK